MDGGVEEATVAHLQAALGDGSVTAVELVTASLARIDALDRAGPTLRSVIEVNPEAQAQAAAADAERIGGHRRGPLHGLPVLLKDNIATGDQMATSAGSTALAGVRAAADAHLVTRLRRAGAVILGKTNLSEWANFRSTRSTSGWSARGGQTTNPYALDRCPSGSSSGSAVAVAASLGVVAVGTETDGSIVSPASINGLVGLKPTVGLVSRHGIIPISLTQDTAGPMARSVADAAALLGVLAGPDPADPATAQGGTSILPHRLMADALQGARLGVVRAQFGSHPSVATLMAEALAVLVRRGAQLVDPVELVSADQLSGPELEVLLSEFPGGLARWLAEFAPTAPVTSLADVIAWNRAQRAEEMPWFDQELFERAEGGGGLGGPAYAQALATCRRLSQAEGIDRVLAEHRLDALVAPTGGPAWLIDLVNGDTETPSFSSPAAVAGYPHLTVPMGQVHGLPVGLSFVGPAWSDGRLLHYGFDFEQATQARRPPSYRPTAVIETGTAP